MSGPWDDYATDDGPWKAYAKSEPVSVSAGRGLMEIPRQAGLAGRYAVEGVAQVADIFAEPLRNFVINPIVSAFGGTPITSQYEAATRLGDAVGLPSPENANERVIGDASRLVAGAGGIAGGAARLPGTIAASLAANPTAQAAGAAGAGLAGGSVREAGGSPLAQMAAAIGGGLAAPTALGSVSRASQGAAAGIRGAIAPKRMEAAIQVELKRAGVDWGALSKEAQAAIVKDAQKAMYSGQPIDSAALRRLADFRNVGATPGIGDITQNPRDVTLQRNLAKQMANTSRPLGGPDLPGLENQNTRTVIQSLEGAADSPLDTYATGQRLRDSVQMTDDAARKAENVLYSQAHDSAGRSVELDRNQFVSAAFDNLQKANRGGWLPAEVRTLLNDISAGQAPFTVDTVDMLKTILATASRSSKDGNTRAAIAAVRNALENVNPQNVAKQATGSAVPITAQTAAGVRAADAARPQMSAEALAAFDKARAAARSRREWQESAEFISDALDGATPDKFVQKHVISASAEELAKVRRFVNNDSELRDAIRKQMVEYIMQRGRVDSDVIKFSSAGMFDAFKALGPRKLAMFFDAKEIGKIRSAINVGRYIQAQPAGSAVNNSNTAAMVWGRLSDILLKGSGLPVVGPMVAEPVRGLALNMQARQVGNVTNALMQPLPRQPIPANPLLLAAGIPSRDQ